MAFRNYRAWTRDLMPTWLRGVWGGKFTEAIAFVFDALGETAYEASGADLLDSPTFPADALPLVGNGRAMERYAAETDATYQARLKDAWNAWPQAGTKSGLLGQLTAAGFDAEIKEMKDWNWDGDAANWSRFWVIFHGTDWTRNKWGDGRKWGQGVWGVNATQAEVHTLRRIIKKWKPAHAVAIVIVVIDEVAWAANQPDGTWGVAANRNRAALYHYER